jgi:hypothetical protein
MKHKSKPNFTPYLVLISVLAAFSLACGLINRALETVTESGLQALEELEVLEQVRSAMELAESGRIDLTDLEAPGAQFLFEIDPYDDVIRWRFYAVNTALADIGTYYANFLPEFLVEQDSIINEQPYLVLTAGHPLSTIYSADQLHTLDPGYQHMASTLLDVEVLHSTAHSAVGRLGLADALGLLPAPLPAESALVILVYNVSSGGWEGFLELAPEFVPSLEGVLPVVPPGLTLDDENGQDDRVVVDDEDWDFSDDDQNGEIQDPSGLCEQVLASGSCYHPYIPVVEGFTRSYQSADGRMTETVSQVQSDGFTLTTEMPDGNVFTTDFECGAAGVTGWAADESVLDAIGAEHGAYTQVEVDGVTIPQDLSLGDTWQVMVNVTVGIQTQGVDSRNVIEMQFEYTAAAQETIATPAGRFNAIRVDFTGSGENTLVVTGPGPSLIQSLATMVSSGSDWYVPCVGKVRSSLHTTWSGITSVETRSEMAITDFGIR